MTQSKFRPDSLTWTIENYDYFSKTIGFLRSAKFPLDEEGPRKWHISFYTPNLTLNDGNEYTFNIVRNKNSMPDNDKIYLEASLSLLKLQMEEFTFVAIMREILTVIIWSGSCLVEKSITNWLGVKL